jgi:predicted transcriptional regulator
MAEKPPVSLRIARELVESFDELAKLRQTTRTQLIEEALVTYQAMLRANLAVSPDDRFLRAQITAPSPKATKKVKVAQ